MRRVLLHLLEHKLFLKAEKCEVHASSVSFLGFIVADGEVTDKVSAVSQWPTPTNEEVQCFLGFTNFCWRFIRNFSSMASPLHALSSSKSAFKWDPRA